MEKEYNCFNIATNVRIWETKAASVTIAAGAGKDHAPTGQAGPAAGPRVKVPGPPRRSLRHRDRQDHVHGRLLRGPGPPGRRVLRIHGDGQNGIPHEDAQGRRDKHRDGEPLFRRADTPRRHQVRRRVRDIIGSTQRRPGMYIYIYIYV